MNFILAKIKEIKPGLWIQTAALLVGLFVDVITLISFFGVVHTPPTSSNYYANNQEYLVWSLIALIYSIGFIHALILRRWRKLYREHSINYHQSFKSISHYQEEISMRELAALLIISFPFTYLYIRAAMAAASPDSSSPWAALLLTSIACWIVGLGLFFVGRGFDKAFSLFSGEGDTEREVEYIGSKASGR